MKNKSLTAEDLHIRLRQAIKVEKMRGKESPSIAPDQLPSRSIKNILDDFDLGLNNSNQYFYVRNEWNITSQRKYLGELIVFLKKAVRRLLRWYIVPPWDQQREFNTSIKHSVEMARELAEACLKVNEEEQNEMLKEDQLDIDYFGFEDKFRGSREDIKKRQSVYTQFFSGRHSVIDIGCGRGEFVELMLDNGINVIGIDINPDMVNFCQGQGLPVISAEAISYLEALDDNSLDGIFASQIVEHLESSEMIQLIRLANKKLLPGGVLAIETINPQNLRAINEWFYMDLTHKRPVHPQTLGFIMEAEGFSNLINLFLNPAADALIPSLVHEEMRDPSNIDALNRLIDVLNHSLFGPQDYAVVGTKSNMQ